MWNGTIDDCELQRIIGEVAPELSHDPTQLAIAVNRLPFSAGDVVSVQAVADMILDDYFANGGVVVPDDVPSSTIPSVTQSPVSKAEDQHAEPSDDGESRMQASMKLARERQAMQWAKLHQPQPQPQSQLQPKPSESSDNRMQKSMMLARERQAMQWAQRHANGTAKTPSVSQEKQMLQARQRAREKWLRSSSSQAAGFSGGYNRVCTIQSLEERDRKRAAAERAMDERADGGNMDGGRGIGLVHSISDFSDPSNIGRRALELTNQFRAENKLPPLRWSQKICEIGIGHSKDMAEGRVPFGHKGFQGRMKRMPGVVRGAAENVAWNSGAGDVGKVAVDGWIHSPGHRRNMLGNYDECGIGVYEHNGRFYLTQLFAKR